MLARNKKRKQCGHLVKVYSKQSPVRVSGVSESLLKIVC